MEGAATPELPAPSPTPHPGRGITPFAASGILAAFDSQSTAPVAQLDRVPGFEPGGRGFESLRARHFFFGSHRLKCYSGKVDVKPDTVAADSAVHASETDSVDLDQIVERLGWSPAERLRYLLDMLAFEEKAHRAKRVDS